MEEIDGLSLRSRKFLVLKYHGHMPRDALDAGTGELQLSRKKTWLFE